jgi:hypothetical protein
MGRRTSPSFAVAFAVAVGVAVAFAVAVGVAVAFAVAVGVAVAFAVAVGVAVAFAVRNAGVPPALCCRRCLGLSYRRHPERPPKEGCRLFGFRNATHPFCPRPVAPANA